MILEAEFRLGIKCTQVWARLTDVIHEPCYSFGSYHTALEIQMCVILTVSHDDLNYLWEPFDFRFYIYRNERILIKNYLGYFDLDLHNWWNFHVVRKKIPSFHQKKFGFIVRRYPHLFRIEQKESTKRQRVAGRKNPSKQEGSLARED